MSYLQTSLTDAIRRQEERLDDREPCPCGQPATEYIVGEEQPWRCQPCARQLGEDFKAAMQRHAAARPQQPSLHQLAARPQPARPKATRQQPARRRPA